MINAPDGILTWVEDNGRIWWSGSCGVVVEDAAPYLLGIDDSDLRFLNWQHTSGCVFIDEGEAMRVLVGQP